MGQNLARNVARNGFPIAVHNRTASKVDEFLEAYGSEGAFTGAHTLTEFVEKLAAPRTILIMVKAGGPVDAVPARARSDVDHRVAHAAGLAVRLGDGIERGGVDGTGPRAGL